MKNSEAITITVSSISAIVIIAIVLTVVFVSKKHTTPTPTPTPSPTPTSTLAPTPTPTPTPPAPTPAPTPAPATCQNPLKFNPPLSSNVKSYYYQNYTQSSNDGYTLLEGWTGNYHPFLMTNANPITINGHKIYPLLSESPLNHIFFSSNCTDKYFVLNQSSSPNGNFLSYIATKTSSNDPKYKNKVPNLCFDIHMRITFLAISPNFLSTDKNIIINYNNKSLKKINLALGPNETFNPQFTFNLNYVQRTDPATPYFTGPIQTGEIFTIGADFNDAYIVVDECIIGYAII